MVATAPTKKPPKKKPRHNANGQGSVYEDKSKKLFYAVLPWGHKPDGSVNYKKSRGFKVKQDAHDELRAMLNERDKGIRTVDGTVTFGMCLDEWLATIAESDKAQKTKDAYAYRVSLVKPHLGDVDVTKLTVGQLDRFLRDLRIKGGVLGRGISATTTQQVHGAILQSLQRAVKKGYVAANVATNTDPIPGLKRDDVKAMTFDQVQTFLRAVEGDRLEALYCVALYTGLRKGELLGLRWSDVEIDRLGAEGQGVIRIRQQALRPKTGPMYIKESPKTGRSRRDLDISADLVAVLRSHRDRQKFEAERVKQSGGEWNPHNLVFVTALGTIIADSGLRHHYLRRLAKADLSAFTIHDLRHTAASLMFQRGMSLVEVSRVLGHKDTLITDRFYLKWIPAEGGKLSSAMAGLRPTGSA